MNSQQFRMSFLACAAWLLPLAAVGCVSTDPADKGTAGSSSAGTPSTTGGSSAGGSTAGGASGGGAPTSADPAAVACPKASVALLTDFTFVDDGMAATKTTATFGDFTNTFSGGTFVYPDGATAMYPLTSDVTMDNWHVSGTVGDYSGVGLFFNKCTLVDASAFKGISFTLSGSVEMGNTLNVNVGAAANDVTSQWLNAHKMKDAEDKHTFGRCTPGSDNQYDGTCLGAAKTVEVTEKPTTVTVLWADLTGGKPAATIDPTEITSVTFSLPAPAGAGTATATTYKADIVIDDLKFVE